jgi:hypothetical protein
MLRVPKPGNYIRMLIRTTSDDANGVEITTPVYTRFVVEERRVLPGRQGLQFQLASEEYGVMIFVDETDFVHNCYPFEIIFDG